MTPKYEVLRKLQFAGWKYQNRFLKFITDTFFVNNLFLTTHKYGIIIGLRIKM